MLRYFQKPLLPKTLYGRVALLIIVPIVALQIILSSKFMQQDFSRVTGQMTQNMAYQINYVLDTINRADNVQQAQVDIDTIAKALIFDIEFIDPAQQYNNKRSFYDISGRTVIATLSNNISGLLGVDLHSVQSKVVLFIDTDLGVIARVVFSRWRVSPSNSHQLPVLMVLSSLILVMVSIVLMYKQIKPISRLAEATKAFVKGVSLSYSPAGSVEIKTTGRSFIDMRQRLEQQIEKRTLMLLGISHDLRTPLTRLKIGLSMLESSSSVHALQNDVRDMEVLLNTLLEFVREDTLDNFTKVDPADIVIDVVKNFQRFAQPVRLRALPAVSAILPLKRLAVKRALENLITNAVYYGHEAIISMKYEQDNVHFVVEDDGDGIAPKNRSAVLKPFFRLDDARSQNDSIKLGLGLAIVNNVARMHKGYLTLDNSFTLGGLKATLVLSLAPFKAQQS